MTELEYTKDQDKSLDQQKAQRNKLFLIFLFLIPLLTILGATFVFKTGIGMPDGTRNKGVLITPPQQIENLKITQEDGQTFHYTGQENWAWTILIPGGEFCTEVCQQRLWFSRQIMTILGQKTSHLRCYYLNIGETNGAALRQLMREEHPKLSTLFTSKAHFNKLFANLGKLFDPVNNHYLLLVDPRGFVMMYYTPEHSAKDVIKDIRFLLKQSGA